MTIKKPLYPKYVHHRPSSGLRNGLCFVRGFYRKILFSFTEKNFLSTFLSKSKNKYFLFPLQVHNDYQFVHSDFESMEQCIDKVISSFASSAPKNMALVIKHHPADRPYKDYTSLVNQLSEKYNLKDRLFYVHDVHLPALLKHACGTVVMNSTVGLSSVFHQTPVMVLAKAVYNIPGIIYDKTLEDFWSSPTKVDMKLYSKFRGWLEHNNQYNGSFYKRIKKFRNHTGVNWRNKK
jgi:capsular polysaccharide export protein